MYLYACIINFCAIPCSIIIISHRKQNMGGRVKSGKLVQ